MRIVTTKHARAGAIASALLVFGGGPAAPSVEPDPQKILDKAEDSRVGGWTSFVFDVKITDEGETGPRAVTNFQVFIKGADRTLIKFTDPGDKGKFLLTVEEGMWLYLPSTSRPIRVTPLQRLAGAASNGDVAQTDFAILYLQHRTLLGCETGSHPLAGRAPRVERQVEQADALRRVRGNRRATLPEAPGHHRPVAARTQDGTGVQQLREA